MIQNFKKRLLIGIAAVGFAATAADAQAAGTVFNDGSNNIRVLIDAGTIKNGDIIEFSAPASYQGQSRAFFVGPSAAGQIFVGEDTPIFGYLKDGQNAFEFAFGSTYSAYVAKAAATGNSTIATNRETLRQEMKLTQRLFAKHIHKALSAPASGATAIAQNNHTTGMNAGTAAGEWGVWGDLGFTRIDDSNAATQIKGNLYDVAAGFDYKLMENFVIGLGFVYGHLGNAKTAFNNGEVRSNSYTFLPYMGYRFNEWFSMDGMIGYGYVSRNTKREHHAVVGGTPIPLGTGSTIKGDPTSHRFLVGIGGNFEYSYDQLNLLARLGYMYSTDRQGSFTESTGRKYSSLNANYSNFNLLARAGYRLDMFEPFLQAGVDYDAGTTDIKFDVGPKASNSNFGYTLGAGFDFFGLDDQVTAGLEFNYHRRSGDYKAYSLNGRVRYEF